MWQSRVIIGITMAFCAAGGAAAHVSEQGFVLLLPTDFYITGGVAAVVLTIVLLAIVPASAAHGLFRPLRLWTARTFRLHDVTSVFSLLLLCVFIWQGWTGSRDPLANPLPLTIWTIWWIGLVSIQGLVFDLWRYLNPFTGMAGLFRIRPRVRLPRRIGKAPALLILVAFSGFLLADPAPADPSRLATVIAAYVAGTLLSFAIFGPRWLIQGEAVTILMRAYAQCAPIGRAGRRAALGLWGWRIVRRAAPGLSFAAIMVALLAVGSFDGLNETFWWLARIGVNPLEYPGRSALIVTTLAGLALCIALIFAVFAGFLWIGLRLAGASGLVEAVRRFAPALLPIALAYHVAHYLPTFLVDAQWALRAASDPFGTGANLLGTAERYVTTGFFNTRDTVRVIWLTQAGAVVIGHIVSILVAHALALRHFGDTRRATLSQAPLAAFMVIYTLFGLWLLASPRGV